MEIRTIRKIAALLLMINGVLHMVEYINTSTNSGSVGILAVGIIYIITGLLLFNKKTYPVYLGVIIPITGMTLSIIKFGVPELISLSALFKLIGITVIICCGYLLVKGKTKNRSTL